MDKRVSFFTKQLETGEVEVKFGWIDKKTLGCLLNTENDSIVVINVALHIVDTYIHEWVHYINPGLTEKQVVAKTQLIINSLKVKQIQGIFNRLAKLAT